MTDQQSSNVVLRFRRKRRRRSKKTGSMAAQMHVLPPARHSKIVSFIANEMRKQSSPEAAEKYLVEHLYIEAGRLSYLGIADDEIERACRAFAVAVWAIVLRGSHTEGVA